MHKSKLKHKGVLKEKEEQIQSSLEGIFQPVIDCLQKQLNFDSIKSVAPLLTKVPFFKKSCPQGTELEDFVTQSLQHMQLENVGKGHVIFHQGEKGLKFYIVLSGTAGVFVPRPLKEIEQEQQEACVQPQTRYGNVSPSRPNQKNTNINQRFLTAVDVLMHLRRDYPEKYLTPEGVLKFHQIVTLNAGDCFGDLALTSDTPRSASILALSDLILLSLTKKDYQLIFKEQVQNDHKKRVIISSAMSQIGIEKTFGPFCSHFKLQTYGSNEYLYKEDDPPKYCYVITEGTVSLLQRVNRLKHNKLSSYSDGQIAGMIELLRDVNRQFSLKTEGCVKAYIISHDQFKIALKQFPFMVPFFESFCLMSEKWIEKRLAHFSMLNSEGFLCLNHENRQLKDVFTPLINGYKFETIRSSETKSPTSQALVEQKSQKFIRIGGPSTLQLNVIEMYQIKDRFIKKDICRSTQSSVHFSPQLKKSLVRHIRDQKLAHKRVVSFQGLISTFNSTAKNTPLPTTSPKKKYFMQKETIFDFYSGIKTQSQSQGSYHLEMKRSSNKLTEIS